MSDELMRNIDNLYKRVQEILDNARKKVYYAANFEMVQAYWNIGREIVEEEQKGKDRAEYGVYLVSQLSEKLTKKFGKGFNERNLFYMRKFYQLFPKVNALRSELTWTHYRILLRVERDNARDFYLNESIK